jgi:hypothetical protein
VHPQITALWYGKKVELRETPRASTHSEQWRREKSVPWTSVQAFAAGNVYDLDIKFITPLRWKNGGGERQLSLLIVRAVADRLRSSAHLSCRNPAYLIGSDRTLSPQQSYRPICGAREIELQGVWAAAKALADSTSKELKIVKKRVMSAARAKIGKAAKKRWAKAKTRSEIYFFGIDWYT